MKASEISVIIPYHNEAETLITTLDLVANQTLQPQEVLLIDSRSTDDSYEVIQDWIKREGNRYTIVFRNMQEGTDVPSSSKNVGIRNASCDLMAFMDCGLLFEKDWLARQMDFLRADNFDVVSGVCYLEGETLLDKSAIAQTYGYRQFRPTVPSSLVKKSVFGKTGLFMEGRRAGYDVDWVNRLGALKIKRGVNRNVIIRYNGINYGKTIKGIFLKNMTYSESAIGLYKYYFPYYYMFLALLFTGGLFIYGPTMLPLLGLYIISRGYIAPVRKSRGMDLLREYPLSLITLPVVGLAIDIGKLIGYIKGTAKQISRYLKSW